MSRLEEGVALFIATLVQFHICAFVRGSIWLGKHMEFQELESRYVVRNGAREEDIPMELCK